MKKIYSGDHQIIIGNRQDLKFWKCFAEATTMPALKLFEKSFSDDDLENLERQLAENETPQLIFLCGNNHPDFEQSFISKFNYIEAAGGVVQNKEGKILMMFRRGKWDLPKGKIDAGEKKKDAALREIEEETGAAELKITGAIKFKNPSMPCTYHIYQLNGEWMLKGTYWYKVRNRFKGTLVPQNAEGITEAGWYSKKEIAERLKNSYGLVLQVLKESGALS